MSRSLRTEWGPGWGGCGPLSSLSSEMLMLMPVEITLTAQTEHYLPPEEDGRDTVRRNLALGIIK